MGMSVQLVRSNSVLLMCISQRSHNCLNTPWCSCAVKLQAVGDAVTANALLPKHAKYSKGDQPVYGQAANVYLSCMSAGPVPSKQEVTRLQQH